ncbi:lactate utilization protein B/C [Nonlabens dokdonensis]|uniref:Lactate utilization protein B/C n=1 Tax=Nonlabens dokdonensis TaxID=328515 RepID=A0A1Z8BBP2_9FLAO|nr:LUD domain-containing protein [Nonlabens dokdonensis]OUS20014.1 lactate utilization protein B/C [Nonlabens dokdonensis]
MSIFKKLFGKSSDSEPVKGSNKERSKYMPDEKPPLDEEFIHNFQHQGGRFLYAIDEKEIKQHFEDILVEHDYFEKNVLCFDDQLKSRFGDFNLNFTTTSATSDFFLATCEYVIANNGAILFSSRQVKETKPADLPDTYVILASTSQIVESIGEGLRGIKHQSKGHIPTNITTLKNFKESAPKQEKDLMNYGAPNKRLYLLLLEDL